MSHRQAPDKFHVAFSFAGEQRDLVRQVAEAVEAELGPSTVYYDDWYLHYLAGYDADLRLQKIYGEQCALAVVCVSEQYGEKSWPLTEHAAIRARAMKARTSGIDSDKDGVLLLRVGDGDVEGILFNTIVPDIRKMTVAQAAELIVARARLIVPPASQNAGDSAAWPEQPPPLRWPMADHGDVRAAFERLLTRGTAQRFLPLRGPSESGKTHITKQILGNALRMPHLACGRFDFKGTTNMEDELRAFVQQLEVPLPPDGPRLNARLGRLLDALKQRAQPTLLVFDTYEAAGEAEDWVEKQLLHAMIRAPWLRVVVAGQKVPESSGASWEAEAAPVITLRAPGPQDWLEFGKPHDPTLTLELVEKVCRLASNSAALLHQLLRAKA